MEITIHNTTKVTPLNGIACRIWEGQTASGIKVHAYITCIAVANEEDQKEFERELRSVSAPSGDVRTIPLRLLI